MPPLKSRRFFLLPLVLLFFSMSPPPGAQGEEFVKITDLRYMSWITDDPKTLLPEFEVSCRAVAAYLNSLDKEFNGDDCVSNLFTAATFIAYANVYIDNTPAANSPGLEKRKQIREQYGRVMSEVIVKAIEDGRAVSRKDHVNLIYTVIVTIAKDILTDYHQNIFQRPEEAKIAMGLAAEEDAKRLRREGEYQAIYDRLAGK